jgi:hypothetical protein
VIGPDKPTLLAVLGKAGDDPASEPVPDLYTEP